MTVYEVVSRVDPVPPGPASPATVVIGYGKYNKKKKTYVVQMSKTNVTLSNPKWWSYLLRINGYTGNVNASNLKGLRKWLDRMGNRILAIRIFTKIIAVSFGTSMGLNRKGVIWNCVAFVGNFVEVYEIVEGRYAKIKTYKVNSPPKSGALGTLNHRVTYMDEEGLKEQGKEQVDNVTVPLITKDGYGFIPLQCLRKVG
jgi:hypothetical protein